MLPLNKLLILTNCMHLERKSIFCIKTLVSIVSIVLNYSWYKKIFCSMVKDIAILWHLDGTDFTRYPYFECRPKYGIKINKSLEHAISACRGDVNCSMVGSEDCDRDTTNYYLCGQNRELYISEKPSACTFRQKGIFIIKCYFILEWHYTLNIYWPFTN